MDSFGDRMKRQYEDRTRYYLPRRTYTIVRIDGKCFHAYTKGMKRPYDEKFNEAMDKTANYVMTQMDGSKLAYTQSDEISILLTDFENEDTQAWFDGNLQKIVSISASAATAYFSRTPISTIVNLEPSLKVTKHALFDARVFTITDPNEVANYFVWRTRDAIRNSINMLGQHYFSHARLHGKNTSEVQDMLVKEALINWNDQPARFKTGSLQTAKLLNQFASTNLTIPTEGLFQFYRQLIPEIPK